MTTVDHHIAVMATTTVQPTPLVPEILLHCAANAYDVWAFTSNGDEEEPDLAFLARQLVGVLVSEVRKAGATA